MFLRTQLIASYSIVVVAVVLSLSYFVYSNTERAIINSEIYQMKVILNEKNHEIETLHERASEDLIFVLKNPLFVEYFELPETKAGNVYKDGILQFTENQYKIKNELEQWIYNFQNKFQVDETCIIDVSGQEHVRLVLKKIENDENLSPDEEYAPFFEPSFKKSSDEVHIQYPYVSPDTNRWVFAYVSPVTLGDGQKPAIYHFEMPINIFQDLVTIDIGRMYVIDPQGFIVADSAESIANAEYKISPLTITDYVPKDYFPSLQSAFSTSEYNVVLDTLFSTNDRQTTYTKYGEEYYMVYEKLSVFDWVLVYEKPKSLMLSGDISLVELRTTLFFISAIAIAAGIITVFVISSHITRPILKLIKATKEITDGSFDTKIQVKGPNEIQDLSHSLSKMIKSLKNTIQLEKDLAIAEQKLKMGELAIIGEMSARIAHDLKNPLAVIKNTVVWLKLTIPNPDEKTALYIDKLDAAVSRMNHQVNDVMDFVRLKTPQLEENSMRQIISATAKTTSIPSNIQLILPQNDIKLVCDQKQFVVALSNLITNAVQAIGDNKGIITIRAHDNAQKSIIQIADSGPGIPAEVLPKIFDPLFTTKQTGTGLGLVSVKNIVEQHGGTITVQNDPVTFTITLPKAQNLQNGHI